MTATAVDIWELCRGTFGKIPAAWHRDLEALAEHYTPAELGAAFKKAKRYKAKSLSYVEKCLQDRLEKAGAEKPEEPAPAKLRCDECRLPTWIDNMTVVDGKGLCRECASPKAAAVPGPGWQRVSDVIGKAVEDGLAQIHDLTPEFAGGDSTPTARMVAAHWGRVEAPDSEARKEGV